MRVRLLKILDATVGFFLCWMGGLLLHLLHRNPAPGRPLPAVIRTILVIRPGGMGDMILLQPALRSLRQHYPEAVIDVVCESRNRDIPPLAGAGVRLLLYDVNPVRTFARLLRGGYDIAIDTEQFHHFSAVMAMFSRAPVRIGFKINPGRNQIYTHLVNYDLEGYEAGEFMRLLHPLGIREEAAVQGCLAAPAEPLAEDLARVERWLLIHAATTSRYKGWDAAKWAEVARRIAEGAHAFSGSGKEAGRARLIVGLVGGANDVGIAEAIAAQSGLGDGVRVLAGRLAFRQTAALIGRAELFVGLDSGLAHLAVASGTPTVVLFGPSDHKKWGVESDHNVVVRKALACSPCFIFGYHKFCHSIACMAEISAGDVLAAVGKLDRQGQAAC